MKIFCHFNLQKSEHHDNACEIINTFAYMLQIDVRLHTFHIHYACLGLLRHIAKVRVPKFRLFRLHPRHHTIYRGSKKAKVLHKT